jgi:hypothetical protein
MRARVDARRSAARRAMAARRTTCASVSRSSPVRASRNDAGSPSACIPDPSMGAPPGPGVIGACAVSGAAASASTPMIESRRMNRPPCGRSAAAMCVSVGTSSFSTAANPRALDDRVSGRARA